MVEWLSLKIEHAIVVRIFESDKIPKSYILFVCRIHHVGILGSESQHKRNTTIMDALWIQVATTV